jgi:periplasmic protein TonB
VFDNGSSILDHRGHARDSMKDSTTGSAARDSVRSGRPRPSEVSHVRPDHPDDVPFLIEQRQKRLGGAFGVSIVTHAAFIAIVAYLISIAPAYTPQAERAARPLSDQIVWIAQEGPGGGGGGGGNQTPEPPRKAEQPGRDRLTVPVNKPPDVVRPPKEEAPEPPPIQQMNIPALAMASGIDTLPGALDGTPVSDSMGPGSGGGAGTGRGTGIGEGTGSGLGPGTGGGTGGGVYRPGSGVSIPRIVREVRPDYTSDAMRAKIQGQVILEAVVMPDGSVGRVEVVRSLDAVFGLDQEAVKAARQWRFVPGMRQGEAVAVLVTIEMTFTLR